MDESFDFEGLEVYRLALQFVEKVMRVTSAFPIAFQRSVGDQFRSAALSIVNNIAEGSGESWAEKARFYRYAARSNKECVPMITLSAKLGLIDTATQRELRSDCLRMAKMMTRLIRSVSRSESRITKHE